MTDSNLSATLSRSALSLQEFIDNSEGETPILPLTHATGAVEFFMALEDSQLAVNDCKIYEEQLLYLFYGRPAYRPNIEVLSTSDEGFRPISILLYPDIDTSIARVVPIDTGALSKGMFSQHCPEAMQKEHFEIESGIEAASRHVRAFFGNNKNYYLSKLREDLILEPTQLVAKAYKSILSNSGQTSADDRRSTIEIQISTNIVLDKSTVMAVAAPEAFFEKDDFRRLIVEQWEADPIRYDIYHDRPVHDVREILSEVKNYLVKKDFL